MGPLHLLREKKYQDALEKWQEIVTVDPAYPDLQDVQVIAKKRLAELTRSLQRGPLNTNMRTVGMAASLILLIGCLAAAMIVRSLYFQIPPTGLPTTPASPTSCIASPTGSPTDSASPTPFIAYKWDYENDTDGWGSCLTDHDISLPKGQNGYLTFNTTGRDPFILSAPSLHINASETPIITIRMRIQGTGSAGAIFFITDKDSNWGGSKIAYFQPLRNEALETYEIDMSKIPTWVGIITQLRLDPVDQPDPLLSQVTIAIDYISVHAP